MSFWQKFKNYYNNWCWHNYDYWYFGLWDEVRICSKCFKSQQSYHNCMMYFLQVAWEDVSWAEAMYKIYKQMTFPEQQQFYNILKESFENLKKPIDK